MKYKDIEEFMKKWPVWISILLFFVPGTLFLVEHGDLELQTFSGTLIIIFIILSSYYSLPFILLGLIYWIGLRDKIRGPVKTHEHFLVIMISAIGMYAFIDFIYRFFSFNHSFIYVYLFVLIVTSLFFWKKIAELF